MKQIFDWMREQITIRCEVKLWDMKLDLYTVSDIINEAEAKWEEELRKHDIEVRNKAIEEFAEKLKYEFNGNIFTDEEKFKYARKEQEQICAQNMSWKMAIKYVDYIAEQLKEE